MGGCSPSKQRSADKNGAVSQTDDAIIQRNPMIGVLNSEHGRVTYPGRMRSGGNTQRSEYYSDDSFSDSTAGESSFGFTPRAVGNSDYSVTPRSVHRDSGRAKWGEVRAVHTPVTHKVAVLARRDNSQFSLDGDQARGHAGVARGGNGGAEGGNSSDMSRVEARLAQKLMSRKMGRAGGGEPNPPGRSAAEAENVRKLEAKRARREAMKSAKSSRVTKISFGKVQLHYFACMTHEGTPQPKTGGPGIGMGPDCIGNSLYKLSEFEKLRATRRTPRERFHREGRMSSAERCQLLGIRPAGGGPSGRR